MPAYAKHERTMGARERAYALSAVALVQVAVGLALLRGLHVEMVRGSDIVQRLVEVTLPKPPPPQQQPPPKPKRREASAPKAAPEKPGGSPGPKPAHAPPSVAPVVAVKPSAAPSGGGTGTGPALGAGAGGGTGGNGYGEDEGGTDLEQIAGEITSRDYPRHLGNLSIGGRVSMTFTVQVNGRVTGCRVTRSSGVPELDDLTCRLIEQRFRFRPSTDRYGRPVSEEVDYDFDWISLRG